MLDFNPDNIKPETMKALGEHLASYWEFFKSGMVIPPELKHRKAESEETDELIKKLIKYLKKGEYDKVLIDMDDQNDYE